MDEMTYVSPTGSVIDLVKPGDWSRRVAYGGVSGLVGTKQAVTVSAVGAPGQTPMGFRTTEMKGSLTLLVVDDGPEGSLDELVSELGREFRPDAYGTLWLSRPFGRASAKVRLDGPIAPPKSFWDSGDADVEVEIPLICDEGLWSGQAVTSTGSVTVTNSGDEFLWPRITWDKASIVNLPSGVTVKLPAPASGRVSLSTNPFTSHEVLRRDGSVDRDLSEKTATLLLGEGVPQGASRTYLLGEGAALEWSLQYLNPWR